MYNRKTCILDFKATYPYFLEIANGQEVRVRDKISWFTKEDSV